MVNQYSWHKLGAKGVCGLAERLNADFWMKLVAQRGTITQTPLCAKFVPRISVDHWVRGVWAYYYLGCRPRRPLALHGLGLYLSQSLFSDQLVFSLDLQNIILWTPTAFKTFRRRKGSSQSQHNCKNVMDFARWGLWDIQTCKKSESNNLTVCRNQEKHILQLIKIAWDLLDCKVHVHVMYTHNAKGFCKERMDH